MNFNDCKDKAKKLCVKQMVNLKGGTNSDTEIIIFEDTAII